MSELKLILDTIALTIGVGFSIVAGFYAYYKTKINKNTAWGKTIDTVGQLATWVVHEAEHSKMNNADKKAYASKAIVDALHKYGIKDVDEQLINGAIETAVNNMHLKNESESSTTEKSPEKTPAPAIID